MYIVYKHTDDGSIPMAHFTNEDRATERMERLAISNIDPRAYSYSVVCVTDRTIAEYEL